MLRLSALRSSLPARLLPPSSSSSSYLSKKHAYIRTLFYSKYIVPELNDITLAAGTIGEQARGSALCRIGNTVVHAALTSARNAEAKDDFLPLTVDYRARTYAVGELPQSNNRKERPGADDDVLVSRVIDRSLRPLFPRGFVDEVQILVTTHANDRTHDPVVAAVNAASMAVLHSKLPFAGPVGCVRIGYVDGKLVVNPSAEVLKSSTLNLLYAGTKLRPLM